ncbi:sarcosine oxidase subunit gamma [Roseibium sp.]|uniref:sarcosine oxidase subunit gamma n=1 Tax=Roseibium sp. TaxID=1936156 RepID=UPI003B50104B
MAEWRSALKGQLSLGKVGTSDGSGVTFSEVTRISLLQIAAWPEAWKSVGAEAARLAGTETAPGPGMMAQGAKGTLLQIEPLKWWLISRDDRQDRISLATEDGVVLDLSSSRTWIKLNGPSATHLLNHFLPLNLSDTAFPVGSVASSAFHHIGITLWREENGFNLLLPRSFAISLWEQLTDSAAQYGCEII